MFYKKANQWVNQFKSLNAFLKASNKPQFTPTTVMEIGNSKYLFIIYDAKINSKGRVVFKVSAEEIELSSGTSKKMLKLPCGHHDGVRFDIDSLPWQYCVALCAWVGEPAWCTVPCLVAN